MNNFELWQSDEALADFRAHADPPDTGIEIREASMLEYVIARSRTPFSE